MGLADRDRIEWIIGRSKEGVFGDRRVRALLQL